VSELVHHLALAVALAGLASAGARVASLAGVDGLARVVAAAVLAAAAAVGEALLLGLVALGGSSLALTVAALGTWLAARLLLPAPEVRLRDELVAWARGLDRGAALALGAVGGLFGAWTAWLLLHPALGHDMVLYHLPEAIQWVHSGHPGAIDPIITGVPVGNYPLTHEVLLAWGLAIGRSLVWATVLTAFAPVLIACAGWLGLRALGVDRVVRALAIAAIVATPAVIASQSGGASLDPAALAWLVSCAALCACARERPGLLPVALVAAALAIGTKTTTTPLALTALAIAFWPARRRLRPLARPLGVALVVAFGVGGVWYLRNIVQHGWPLWPFSSAPWGDPRPEIIANADVKFIDRPGETIDRLGSYYLDHFGGPLLVFCGALAAAVLARTRAVAFAAAAALVSMFIWMNAPFTGVFGETRAFDIGTGDATRYLLPGAAAAALAGALASRRGGRLRVACALLLAVAAAIGLRQTHALGFPNVPALSTGLLGLVVGAIAGAAVWFALRARPWAARNTRLAWPATLAASLLIAGALGTAAANGFIERHSKTGTRESPLAAWFAAQPEWRDGDEPVASTWSLVGTLAGDRLHHPLVLVGAREACARGAEGGWLVVDRNEARLKGASDCAAEPPYEDRDFQAYGPASRLPAP